MKTKTKKLKKQNKKLKRANWDLIQAIRLTQEYSQLPAVKGWEWYDALEKHSPETLAHLVRSEPEKVLESMLVSSAILESRREKRSV